MILTCTYLIHVGFPECLPWVLEHWPRCDSVVLTVSKETFDAGQEIIRQLPRSTRVLVVENRGMDIGPFFHAIDHLHRQPAGFPDIVVKLHTKSDEDARSNCWVPLASQDDVMNVFANKPWVQMITAPERIVPASFEAYRDNEYRIGQLCNTIGIEVDFSEFRKIAHQSGLDFVKKKLTMQAK